MSCCITKGLYCHLAARYSACIGLPKICIQEGLCPDIDGLYQSITETKDILALTSVYVPVSCIGEMEYTIFDRRVLNWVCSILYQHSSVVKRGLLMIPGPSWFLPGLPLNKGRPARSSSPNPGF